MARTGIGGCVLFSNSKYVCEIRVSAWTKDRRPVRAATSLTQEDGSFHLDVPPGLYRVSVLPPASYPVAWTREVMVRAPECGVELRLVSGGCIAARVVYEAGSPCLVEGVVLRVRACDQVLDSASYSLPVSRGEVQVPNMPVGDYHLQVEIPDPLRERYAVRAPSVIRVPSSDTVVQLCRRSLGPSKRGGSSAGV